MEISRDIMMIYVLVLTVGLIFHNSVRSFEYEHYCYTELFTCQHNIWVKLKVFLFIFIIETYNLYDLDLAMTSATVNISASLMVVMIILFLRCPSLSLHVQDLKSQKRSC